MIDNPNVKLADIVQGLQTLLKVPEVTMYVVPEGVLLSRAENGTMMEEILSQCNIMRTAVAIFRHHWRARTGPHFVD